jgi:hypothetical protein
VKGEDKVRKSKKKSSKTEEGSKKKSSKKVLDMNEYFDELAA